MKRGSAIVALAILASAAALCAQETPRQAPDRDTLTVRGCLRSERGNYILIENKTGTVYALQGVGTNLNGFLRKEIEVTGEAKAGSVRTGVRPEKAGSNPSDTVHGVDGVPLQVRDIHKDIRVVAKHCMAADQQ